MKKPYEYIFIERVIGREIIDSRGNPTVEAEVWLGYGWYDGKRNRSQRRFDR